MSRKPSKKISGTDLPAATTQKAQSSPPARVAHIGIAVRDLDEALRLYHETLGLPLHGRESVESDGVNVAFLPAGDTELELLEATGPESPVARFIEKRGEGIHHIALEVDDVTESLKILSDQGYRLIDEEPRIGAGGVRVAFVHPRSTSGVLIELCEKGGDGRS
ncbi:MAG: methylmalonyl-CoA epimerase [Gemmatimonadetes bacterium]|nr:methylmalonyl-CoA epimerase [Gemmatimonadota bacterium]